MMASRLRRNLSYCERFLRFLEIAVSLVTLLSMLAMKLLAFVSLKTIKLILQPKLNFFEIVVELIKTMQILLGTSHIRKIQKPFKFSFKFQNKFELPIVFLLLTNCIYEINVKLWSSVLYLVLKYSDQNFSLKHFELMMPNRLTTSSSIPSKLVPFMSCQLQLHLIQLTYIFHPSI